MGVAAGKQEAAPGVWGPCARQGTTDSSSSPIPAAAAKQSQANTLRPSLPQPQPSSPASSTRCPGQSARRSPPHRHQRALGCTRRARRAWGPARCPWRPPAAARTGCCRTAWRWHSRRARGAGGTGPPGTRGARSGRSRAAASWAPLRAGQVARVRKRDQAVGSQALARRALGAGHPSQPAAPPPGTQRPCQPQHYTTLHSATSQQLQTSPPGSFCTMTSP